MSAERKYVMSIAGFDPCGGAGLLADIKTYEQHKVYGLSISTANTLQTENNFYSVEWNNLDNILSAINVLLNKYPVQAIKIGIVPSLDFLFQIVSQIKNKNSEIKIIVDPIIKSSTGFKFQHNDTKEKLISVLEKIYLLTPNIQEATILVGNTNEKKSAKELSKYCNVLLKGGHSIENSGIDFLFTKENYFVLSPISSIVFAKHGSGCVLSAAITANLALGFDLKTSCINAKKYVEQFLCSNKSLLGFHNISNEQ